MSNRLFQGIIHQMKDAIDRTIGVVDTAGTIVCCSDLGRIGETDFVDMKEILATTDIKVIAGKTFLAVGSQSHPDSAVFVDGNDENAANYARLISISLGGIKQYYDVKFDRSNFVKNVILDNILPGDVYVRAKELHFVAEVPRALFLVRQVGKTDVAAIEVMQNQLRRLRDTGGSSSANMLFFNILTETKTMVLHSRNIVKSLEHFVHTKE